MSPVKLDDGSHKIGGSNPPWSGEVNREKFSSTMILRISKNFICGSWPISFAITGFIVRVLENFYS